MKKFCITGGIACGKSTVADQLAADGWPIIDTDLIAREQLAPDTEGYKKVVDAFGEFILNDQRQVDRSLLGLVVFSDVSKRSTLNSILHPLIRAASSQRLAEFTLECRDVRRIVFIVPLLYEVGWEVEFDSVACIASPAAAQLARLRVRGLDATAARQRLAAQWPTEEKIKRSQIVLWNNGSLALLNRQVELLKTSWLSL
ncbi:MAG: dephospho-CoA kinase [Verrucomicrobiales bacterium]|jgi:dephospho-CoA kinase|nr:dephospho-CoA kinase [Verrucomicrobiales bacterium]